MWDQVISLWMNGEDLNAVWIELLRHGDASAAANTTGIVVRGRRGHHRGPPPTEANPPEVCEVLDEIGVPPFLLLLLLLL
jgi:hypothetical protein